MMDLRCGRAEDILTTLADASVDALVTDPPAGVSFMGKDWDGHKGGRDQWIAWLAGIMAEARRVITPGGYALVWALPRTSHWTATALDDGGWRIIDIITHHFGQGFPKGKGQLKPASEHWILCRAPGPLRPLQIDAARVATGKAEANGRACKKPADHLKFAATYSPMAGDGAGWDGRGGRWPPNLLLSHHPDCRAAGVRRVPADRRGQGRPRGTFPHSDDAWGNGHRADTGAETAGDGTQVQQAYRCVDGCPIKALDEQAGPRTSGARAHDAGEAIGGHWRANEGRMDTHRWAKDNAWPATTGSASRFFPTFGPDPADAVPGLDESEHVCYNEAWARTDHPQSTPVASGTPRPRDTTASPSGTPQQKAPAPSLHTSGPGNRSTDPSLTATNSTTATATSKTTDSTTCASSMPSPTSACTVDANSEATCGGSPATSAAHSSPSMPSTGILAGMDGPCTDAAGPATSAKPSPSSSVGVPFIYVPKASSRERSAGLPEGQRSPHPTVKPVALMQWLVRLVTPEGGVVLDPFSGSGSTGVACVREGFGFIGIDMSAEYVDIARGRIAHEQERRDGQLALPLGHACG